MKINVRMLPDAGPQSLKYKMLFGLMQRNVGHIVELTLPYPMQMNVGDRVRREYLSAPQTDAENVGN